MKWTGGCYCGQLRYEISSEPLGRAQCHCRQCQYFTGGHPQVAMAVPRDAFRYSAGTPTRYTRADLENPVTRHFCPACGVHLVAESPALPDALLVRPGTLDDPDLFGRPQIAVFTREKRLFHHVPDEVPSFADVPRDP